MIMLDSDIVPYFSFLRCLCRRARPWPHAGQQRVGAISAEIRGGRLEKREETPKQRTGFLKSPRGARKRLLWGEIQSGATGEQW
jgi:hypothetical protein